MKLEPLGTRAKREEILRGVFEENLRMSDKPVPPKRLGRSGWSRWAPRLVMAVTVVLVVFGGVQIYREIRAQEPPPVAEAVPAVSAAERMEMEFAANAGVEPEGLFGSEQELPIAQLFDLEVRTIVIDPGHGGADPGASGPTGTREKDITLDVARRLRRHLEQRGFRILMTREDDEKVSLHDRVAFANEQNADLFISLHVNAFPTGETQVVETYYFGLADDERTRRLAGRENIGSEISNAEFMDAVEKMGQTMKFQESKHLATSIQNTLYRNIRSENSEVSDWGAKPGPFVVLLGVEVPSVLAEISVITNKAEEAKLNTPGYRERLAASLEAGIIDYLYPGAQPDKLTDETTDNGSKENDE